MVCLLLCWLSEPISIKHNYRLRGCLWSKSESLFSLIQNEKPNSWYFKIFCSLFAIAVKVMLWRKSDANTTIPYCGTKHKTDGLNFWEFSCFFHKKGFVFLSTSPVPPCFRTFLNPSNIGRRLVSLQQLTGTITVFLWAYSLIIMNNFSAV